MARRKNNNLGRLTEDEERRKLECTHCGTVFVPEQYSESQFCTYCKSINFRNPKRIVLGEVPEPAVRKNRTGFKPLEPNRFHKIFFDPSQAKVFNAIYKLNQEDKPCFIQGLADELDVPRKTVQKHVYRFDSLNLLNRNWTARGRKEIKLTPLGEKILGAVNDFLMELSEAGE